MPGSGCKRLAFRLGCKAQADRLLQIVLLVQLFGNRSASSAVLPVRYFTARFSRLARVGPLSP
jgi:hypothetical protein